MATTKTVPPRQTANNTKPQQPPPAQQNAVAVIPPRLPYIDEVKEHFKEIVTGEPEWRALVESIFPLAKTPQSVSMALAYCARRKLDPFKRVCHIVPVWSAAAGKMVEQVWPGIAELRTTATRTGVYAGMDVPQFGEFCTQQYKGRVQNYDKSWRDVDAEVTYPEFCQITLYRIVAGHRVPFPGPKVYYSEVFSRMGRFADVPNDKWQKSPVQMLEKVAEAAALRRAFPEEMGDERAIEEYNDAEGEGENARDVTNEGSASTSAPATMPKREDYQPKPEPQEQQQEKPAAQTAQSAQTAEPAKPIPKNEPLPREQQATLRKTVEQADPRRQGPMDPDPPPHDPGTGEIIEGTATRVEDEPLGGNELEDDPLDGATFDSPPPKPIEFPKFPGPKQFMEWSESWLDQAARTPEEAKAWEQHYRDIIKLMSIHTNAKVQEAAARIISMFSAVLAREPV